MNVWACICACIRVARGNKAYWQWQTHQKRKGKITMQVRMVEGGEHVWNIGDKTVNERLWQRARRNTHLKKSWWFGISITALFAMLTSCLHATFYGIQWLSRGFHQCINASLVEEDEQSPVTTGHALPASVSLVILCQLGLRVQTRVVYFIEAR